MSKWLLRAKEEISSLSSYRSSMISCCDCDQMRLTRPVNSDKRNPTSLMTVVSDGESEISPPNEEEVIVTTKEWNENERKDTREDLAEWSDEDASLIEWFQTATLPMEPFQLNQGVKVLDSERFYSSLKIDIAAGPRKPRASLGGLQSDLRALREFVLMNY